MIRKPIHASPFPSTSPQGLSLSNGTIHRAALRAVVLLFTVHCSLLTSPLRADTPIKDLKITGPAVVSASATPGSITFQAGSKGIILQPTVALSGLNIDWPLAETFTKTLSANSTFTFSNTVDDKRIYVYVTNTAGNFTVTWPAGIIWPGGTQPVQTTGAKTDLWKFHKAGSVISGEVVQNFSAAATPTATATATASATPTTTPTATATATPTATATATATPTATATATATPPPSPQTFTYVSDGDTNGVFYFIGQNLGTGSWTNPDTAAYLVSVRSSDGAGTANDLVNRAAENTFSNNVANSWIAVDLGAGRSVVVSDYSLRMRNTADPRAMRNWKLQGTNTSASNSVSDLNAATWTDIDSHSADTTMANTSGAWGFFTLGSTPSGYRWIRVLQDGPNGGSIPDNFLGLCEWELYGELSY